MGIPNSLSKRRGSSVGIATAYGLDDRGGRSSSPGRVMNFHFSISSRTALEFTLPPSQRVLGLFLRGVNGQGREAGHSPPTIDEVKKT
jgi:hypothetical protein